MKFICSNKKELNKISNYIATKYYNFEQIVKFQKDINKNFIIVEMAAGDEQFSNEKDLINSVREFAKDEGISLDIEL